MNGPLCHRREKRMEGTSGAEERPCRSIYRVYSRSTSTRSETASASDKRYDVGVVGVDFFSQARKTLSQRSPFDIPEGGGYVFGLLSVPTLPSGLASMLKQTDKKSTLSAEVELISTMAENKSWTRAPIQMEFQVAESSNIPVSVGLSASAN